MSQTKHRSRHKRARERANGTPGGRGWSECRQGWDTKGHRDDDRGWEVKKCREAEEDQESDKGGDTHKGCDVEKVGEVKEVRDVEEVREVEEIREVEDEEVRQAGEGWEIKGGRESGVVGMVTRIGIPK